MSEHEELLERLKSIKLWCEATAEMSHGFTSSQLQIDANAIGDAIALLEQQRWRDVNVELPVKMDWYRCFISTPERAYQRDLIYSEPHGGWLDEGGHAVKQVSRWMPLPPAPEGE